MRSMLPPGILAQAPPE